MSKREIILSEASREMMPETIRADVYYAANDHAVQQENALKEEIRAYAEEFEPWQIEVARRHSEGVSIQAIAKNLKKSRKTISDALNDPALKQLIHYYVHLRIYQDGPNEMLRKNMLWRIAVRNEEDDPKEAIKAISELNRMSEGARGSGSFNIVINGIDLKKGALDG